MRIRKAYFLTLTFWRIVFGLLDRFIHREIDCRHRVKQSVKKSRVYSAVVK
jgi:hypothetical protein